MNSILYTLLVVAAVGSLSGLPTSRPSPPAATPTGQGTSAAAAAATPLSTATCEGGPLQFSSTFLLCNVGQQLRKLRKAYQRNQVAGDEDPTYDYPAVREQLVATHTCRTPFHRQLSLYHHLMTALQQFYDSRNINKAYTRQLTVASAAVSQLQQGLRLDCVQSPDVDSDSCSAMNPATDLQALGLANVSVSFLNEDEGNLWGAALAKLLQQRVRSVPESPCGRGRRSYRKGKGRRGRKGRRRGANGKKRARHQKRISKTEVSGELESIPDASQPDILDNSTDLSPLSTNEVEDPTAVATGSRGETEDKKTPSKGRRGRKNRRRGGRRGRGKGGRRAGQRKQQKRGRRQRQTQGRNRQGRRQSRA